MITALRNRFTPKIKRISVTSIYIKTGPGLIIRAFFVPAWHVLT
ncbi:hypothetical protein MuYL_4789 [Mucilaginibacter xinganensis]|uniref:Uncharacterized protein n=1 Tax=Mucilaginibacter xinganensis TaxID=1234841 RepID=A0A223P3L1_9SPHI|nr:hypothetical protein MuYL_4789 [Mucilaginibacter xinganensis]